VPRRQNYRGRTAIFPFGALLLASALAALAVTPSRWLVFLGGVGALGLVDDLLGASGPRGLRGHARALARGRFSTGAVKAGGTVMLAAYVAADPPGLGQLTEVAVLVLAAHVGNLLDTRPGRAEKALALVAAALCLATSGLEPLGVVAPLLPVVAASGWLTLRERAMLGDSGASLIGGMIGVLVVTGTGFAGSAVALVILAAITLYGEVRSISTAIDRLPLLRRFDALGRPA
jgi:UDP-GlcNAc:undecaprenyl-phosphate GlcNAc-1-phosphate transferase